MPVCVASVAHLAAARIAEVLERQSGVQHACEAETSLWLAIDPAQVRRDQLEAAVSPGGGIGASGSAVTRFWSFAERAPETGVRGDPRVATAEKGEAILEAMAEGLAKAMQDPVLWRTPDAVWASDRIAGPRTPQ
jgi:creatinine amidohydrolase